MSNLRYGFEIPLKDPRAMFALVDNTDVARVAEEANLRLRRVFDAIASAPESGQMHAPPKDKR